MQPSNFAVFCKTNYITADVGWLIDIGCGNFRDTHYFQESKIPVISLDQIEYSDNVKSKAKYYIKSNVSNLVGAARQFPINCVLLKHYYMRWLLHSLSYFEEIKLFDWIGLTAKQHSYLYIECRSDKDSEIKDTSHYRRLINSAELIDMVESIGFDIKFFTEDRGFSKLGADDPLLIRLVAQKIK
jgi:hypothetical protein